MNIIYLLDIFDVFIRFVMDIDCIYNYVLYYRFCLYVEFVVISK